MTVTYASRFGTVYAMLGMSLTIDAGTGRGEPPGGRARGGRRRERGTVSARTSQYGHLSCARQRTREVDLRQRAQQAVEVGADVNRPVVGLDAVDVERDDGLWVEVVRHGRGRQLKVGRLGGQDGRARMGGSQRLGRRLGPEGEGGLPERAPREGRGWSAAAPSCARSTRGARAGRTWFFSKYSNENELTRMPVGGAQYVTEDVSAGRAGARARWGGQRWSGGDLLARLGGSDANEAPWAGSQQGPGGLTEVLADLLLLAR